MKQERGNNTLAALLEFSGLTLGTIGAFAIGFAAYCLGSGLINQEGAPLELAGKALGIAATGFLGLYSGNKLWHEGMKRVVIK